MVSTNAASGLQGFVEAEFWLIQDNQGSGANPPGDKFTVTSKYVTNFSMTMADRFNGSQFEFTIEDPAWEFANHFNLHQLNVGCYLMCRYRFGWHGQVYTESYNKKEEGPNETGWLVGRIMTITPSYTTTSFSITLRGVGAAMETHIYSITRQYAPIAQAAAKSLVTVGIGDNTTIKSLYADIARTFKINIIGIEKIAATVISIPEIPPKNYNITGLDYLTDTIFHKYPPYTAGGEKLYASVKPEVTTAGFIGTFELSTVREIIVTRTYSLYGTAANVLSYNPEIKPWSIKQALELGVKANVLDPDSKGATENITDPTGTVKGEMKTLPGETSTGNYRAYSTSATGELGKLRLLDSNTNLLSNSITANLEVLGDNRAAVGQIFKINIYNPVTGSPTPVTSRYYIAKAVQHDIQGGVFRTTLTLVFAKEKLSDGTETAVDGKGNTAKVDLGNTTKKGAEKLLFLSKEETKKAQDYYDRHNVPKTFNVLNSINVVETGAGVAAKPQKRP